MTTKPAKPAFRAVLSAALLFAAAAASAEALPAFDYSGFDAVRAARRAAPPEPAPPSAAGDVIGAGHMYLQAGTRYLFGYAQTPAQLAEATAYWTAALAAAGVEAGKPERKDHGMFLLPYKTADGRAIRSFVADPLQFPPKDEAGLRANMAGVQGALAKENLTPLLARVLNLPGTLPSYCVFYLSGREASADHERRARVMKVGGALDFGMLRAAGVDIVQTPLPGMMVYVGPEIGFATAAASSRADAEEALARQRRALAAEGKSVIADRVTPAGAGFVVETYFYQ